MRSGYSEVCKRFQEASSIPAGRVDQVGDDNEPNEEVAIMAVSM